MKTNQMFGQGSTEKKTALKTQSIPFKSIAQLLHSKIRK
jgi:hypothetical protein